MRKETSYKNSHLKDIKMNIFSYISGAILTIVFPLATLWFFSELEMPFVSIVALFFEVAVIYCLWQASDFNYIKSSRERDEIKSWKKRLIELEKELEKLENAKNN